MLVSTGRLDRRGFDLVNVLYHMQTNDDAGWNDLLRVYAEEFPTVTRLEFAALDTPGRVALRVHDRRFGKLHAFQLSDGQVELLAVLAATLATPSLTSPAAAVLAFDEPDAHFHPSLMKRLASVLERAAERSAVVVATHSDRFLDFLSDPAGSVRVLEAKGQGTCVRQLDSSTLDAWREHYTLSELRARGQLDPANSEGDPAR
jgi:predicted ATPase